MTCMKVGEEHDKTIFRQLTAHEGGGAEKKPSTRAFLMSENDCSNLPRHRPNGRFLPE